MSLVTSRKTIRFRSNSGYGSVDLGFESLRGANVAIGVPHERFGILALRGR